MILLYGAKGTFKYTLLSHLWFKHSVMPLPKAVIHTLIWIQLNAADHTIYRTVTLGIATLTLLPRTIEQKIMQVVITAAFLQHHRKHMFLKIPSLISWLDTGQGTGEFTCLNPLSGPKWADYKITFLVPPEHMTATTVLISGFKNVAWE